jgi:hypothetical protein
MYHATTHLHMRAHASLSTTAGSFQRATLQIHFDLTFTNATALLESML